MTPPARLTWYALEPAFPVALLLLIYGANRWFHVTSTGGALAVGAGIAIVLISTVLWRASRAPVPPRNALIRRSHVAWGIAFILLGVVAPVAGVLYIGTGLVFMGLLYVAMGAIAIARNQD